MTDRGLFKTLGEHWHRRPPLEDFQEIDAIEAAIGAPLPADLKQFYQFFSDGGEGRLAGGYLRLLPMDQILEYNRSYRIASAFPRFVVIGLDGDDAFALDLSRNRAAASYPVVWFSLPSMDPDEVEDVGAGFREFLERRAQIA